MNVLSLFSGIGGIDLAAEMAGMHTVAFCEIDPFCRRVLRKHWPSVRCYEDVRDITADRLRDDGIPWPAVIAGGFPCQDISAAGKGAGIEHGERSRLWCEFARIIGDLRPRYVVVENVAALLHRGLDRVCGDLATLGYDATWATYGADAVGAPHRRERVFIVGYHAGVGQADPDLAERQAWSADRLGAGTPTGTPARDGSMADTHAGRWDGWTGAQRAGRRLEPSSEGSSDRGHRDVADTGRPRPQGEPWTGLPRAGRPSGQSPGERSSVGQADAAGDGWEQGRAEPAREQGRSDAAQRGASESEAGPLGGRTASGIRRPGMVDAHGEPPRRLAEPRAQRGEREPQPGMGGVPAKISPGLVQCGLNRWPARPGEQQHDWEPPRLATGVKQRVAKLRALGNAVVPLQALPVFTAIMQAEQEGGR